MAQWLTIAQIAEQLQVDPETIRRLITSGKLPATMVATNWRIQPADLNNYLTARQHAKSAKKKVTAF